MNENRQAEAFWSLMQPCLDAFKKKIVTHDPSLKVHIGHASQAVFFLWGTLEVARSGEDDAVGVAFDAKFAGEQIELTSEFCTASGEEIEDGPSASVSLQIVSDSVEDAFGQWVFDFKNFLVRIEGDFMARVDKLS